jgi:hypothetical protein
MLPMSPELESARTRLHVTASQVQHLRKDYSACRAQSSNSRHSTWHHDADKEVDQLDLQGNINNNRDLHPLINNRH